MFDSAQLLEVIATLTGITAVFFVAENSHRLQITGFLLFCVCNICWLGFGLENANYGLMLQNVVFLLANFRGIYNRRRASLEAETAKIVPFEVPVQPVEQNSGHRSVS